LDFVNRRFATIVTLRFLDVIDRYDYVEWPPLAFGTLEEAEIL